MPNHVHAIVKPLADSEDPLETILQSWKRHTATKINRQQRLQGPLWQEESYDRIIRDEEHLFHCIAYIGSNATRAGLSQETVPRWMRPEWERLGWGFAP